MSWSSRSWLLILESTLPFPFIHFTMCDSKVYAFTRHIFVDCGLKEILLGTRVDGRNSRLRTRYLNNLYAWLELITEKVKVLKENTAGNILVVGGPDHSDVMLAGRHRKKRSPSFGGTDYPISSATPNDRRIRIPSDSSCHIP